jgi:hypothetical protein
LQKSLEYLKSFANQCLAADRTPPTQTTVTAAVNELPPYAPAASIAAIDGVAGPIVNLVETLSLA